MQKRNSILNKVILLALLMNLIISCNLFVSIVDGRSTGQENPGLERPHIFAITPADNSTGVSENAAVILVFDKSLDPTVTGKIRFTNPSVVFSNGVNCSMTFSTKVEENDMVSITADNPLPFNAPFTGISIDGFKDTTGVAMTIFSDTAYSFTIIEGSDFDPPEIVNIYPADGSTGVAADSDITLRFNEGLDGGNPGTVYFSSNNITFEDGVNCTVSFSQTAYINDTVNISPYENIPLGMVFSNITISSFSDTSGNNMAEYDDPAYSFTIVSMGLIAYYPFDGDADDDSSNGNSGTVYGAVLTTDRYGVSNSAFLFDGVNDYIDTGITDMTGDYTLAAWVNLSYIPSSPAPILAKQSNIATPETKTTEFDLRLTNANLNAYKGNGFSDGVNIDGNNSPSNDIDISQWHHVAMVMDDAECRIYLNGNLSATATFSGERQYGPNPIYISRHEDQISTHYFPGMIDDVRIYNYAIASSDVTDIFIDESPPSLVVNSIPVPGNGNTDVPLDSNFILKFDQSLDDGFFGTVSLDSPSVTFNDASNCTMTLSTDVYPNDTLTIEPNNNSVLGQSFSGLTVSGFRDVRGVMMEVFYDPGYSFTASYIIRDGIIAPGQDYAESIAVDSGDNIVIGGYGGSSGADLFIARLDTDGATDGTFGGGIQTLDYTADGLGGDDRVFETGVDQNGRILTIGSSEGNATGHNLLVTRYNTDGSPDNSFSGDGFLHHNYTGGGTNNEFGYGLYIDDLNNELYATGIVDGPTGTEIGLWKYDFSGLPVNSFSGFSTNFITFGHSTGAETEQGKAVVMDGSGSIYIAGQAYNGSSLDAFVLKLHSNGTTDSSFDGDGWAFFGNPGTDEVFNDVIIDGNGKILVTGNYYNGADWDIMIVRYNADGTKDNSFGTDGYVIDVNGSGDDKANSVLVDGSGKILVGGVLDNGTDGDPAVWRFNADGSKDNSFGTSGIRSFRNSGTDTIKDIAIDSGGRIFATGQLFNGSDPDLLLWQAN